MIACVLRHGGVYTPDHVRALRAQCAQWAAVEPFVCLTDRLVPGIVCHRLEHGWPGWWSKLELFRPGVFPDGTRVLYLDLDTVVTGPLQAILDRPEPLIVLEDFYRHPPTFARGIGSGVMAWTAGDPRLTRWYTEFASDPTMYMRACGTGGDQRYLETCLTLEASWKALTFWQDCVPSQIVSYKVHVRNGTIPPGARIVCFHGRPKPWEVPALAPREPCPL